MFEFLACIFLVLAIIVLCLAVRYLRWAVIDEKEQRDAKERET